MKSPHPLIVLITSLALMLAAVILAPGWLPAPVAILAFLAGLALFVYGARPFADAIEQRFTGGEASHKRDQCTECQTGSMVLSHSREKFDWYQCTWCKHREMRDAG